MYKNTKTMAVREQLIQYGRTYLKETEAYFEYFDSQIEKEKKMGLRAERRDTTPSEEFSRRISAYRKSITYNLSLLENENYFNEKLEYYKKLYPLPELKVCLDRIRAFAEKTDQILKTTGVHEFERILFQYAHSTNDSRNENKQLLKKAIFKFEDQYVKEKIQTLEENLFKDYWALNLKNPDEKIIYERYFPLLYHFTDLFGKTFNILTSEYFLSLPQDNNFFHLFYSKISGFEKYKNLLKEMQDINTFNFHNGLWYCESEDGPQRIYTTLMWLKLMGAID